MNQATTRIRPRLLPLTAAFVAIFSLFAAAAWAISSSSSADLADPVALAAIGRGEGVEVNPRSVETAFSDSLPAVQGVTVEVVEYDTNIGRCEDIVLRLEGRSGSVGHCGTEGAPAGTTLGEANLGSGGIDLAGRYFQIVDGRVAADTFPPGTTIEADLEDGSVLQMPVMPDGRFLAVRELESAPGNDEDASLFPLTWRAVDENGAVLDTYTRAVPEYPIKGP